MQLAKNNNAMWRVISNGDQPLPHVLQHPDLNKYQESQFTTKKAEVSPEKLQYVIFKSCLTPRGPDQRNC